MGNVVRSIPFVLLFVAATACGGSSPVSEAHLDAATSPTATPEPAAEPEATPEPAAEPEATLAATPEPATTDGSSATDAEGRTVADIGVGPYPVGVETITVIDAERDRTFFVDVWFPLANGTIGELAEYTFVTGDSFTSARALAVGPAAASSDGPFPLVVYSHGSGGIRYIHSDYTESIASHGYVVAAPDHPGNTAVERVLGTPTDIQSLALDRPLDIIHVIDTLVDAESDAARRFTPLIDETRIAVTGHSFGGYTALAVAAGVVTEAGSSPRDDRVDAILPLAPAVGDGGDESLLSTAQLETIDVPAMIIAGTDDTTTPIDPNVETLWRHLGSTELYRFDLVDAAHQTFTDLCDYADALLERDDATPIVVETIVEMSTEGCSPDDMPIERAKALTNGYAVTFLDAVFRAGDAASLDPDHAPDDVIAQARTSGD